MRKTAEWRRMDEFVNLTFQSFRKDSASEKMADRDGKGANLRFFCKNAGKLS